MSEIHKLGRSISICTYNILAQTYAKIEMFPYAKGYLKWKGRRKRLLERIVLSGSDIYCFQEMDNNYSEQYWRPEFGRFNLSLFYVDNPNNHKQSIAIAYKKSKYKLIDHKIVHLSDINTDEEIKISNIGVIAQFITLSDNFKFIVSNTHLYWNPLHPEIKSAQIQYLHRNIVEYNRSNLPVILCGDFNSLPDSTVYEFITNKMTSVYYKYYNEEPKYTNYTHEFAGPLDYIFISSDINVELCRRLSSECLGRNRPLPNELEPSDHVPIFCVLVFKDTPETEKGIINNNNNNDICPPDKGREEDVNNEVSIANTVIHSQYISNGETSKINFDNKDTVDKDTNESGRNK